MNIKYKPLEVEGTNKDPLIQSKEKEFDDDAIPPNFDYCYQHLQATSVGIEDTRKNEFCKCCASRTTKNQIGLFEDSEKLAYLGPGYPLFFAILKFSIAFLLMFLIIVGIYELSSNSAGVNCTQNPNCHPNWAILLSIYNKANDDHAMTTQQWLNVALILVMTILIQLMRRKKRLTAARCDERDISASDYTLMVENIPRESSIDHKKELKRLFEELECFADSKDNSKRVQFKVMKINLTYNLSELIKLKKNEEDAVAKKTKAFFYRLHNERLPDGVSEQSLDEEINKREAEILAFEKKLFEGGKGEFTGVAFVSFQTEEMKQEILNRYKITTLQRFLMAFDFLMRKNYKLGLFFKNQRLFVSQASEPSDVYWNNLHLQDKERYFRKFLGYVFTTFLLFLCATMIYYMLIKQNDLKNESKSNSGDQNQFTEINVLTYLLAFAIVVVNKILGYVIPLIAGFEKNKTITQDYSSTVLKLSLALFINSGFLTFLVTYVYIGNYAGEGGLFIATTTVFISNALLNPLLYTLNIGYWYAKFKRWYYSRQGVKCSLTQRQANKAFENPDFPIQTTSATLINTLWFTSFYSSVLPIGIMFSLLCFIYEYYALKHMVLRRSSIIHELGDELAEQMTDLVELSLFWFALGNFLFNTLFDLENPITVPSVLVLVIGIIHYILPTEKINEHLFKIVSKDEVLIYDIVCLNFDKDYDRENPATKDVAIFDRLESGNNMIYFLIFFACFSEFQSLQTNISYYQPIGWPFVLAHRGASGYLPESTLEAFEVAIYGKTDFVEMDVVLTKDKQLLVMHDPYLSRVTNIEDFPEFFDRKSTRIIDNKSISDYFTDNFTLQELKQLSIRQGLIDERPKIFDYKFKAPSLDEFLKFMIDRNQKIKENYPQQKLIGVFLEAKNGNMYKEIYGSDFEIGELLLKKLDEFGLADANNATMYCPIVLQSFPIETTKYFEESGNKLPRIQLLHHESYNYDLEEVNRYAHGVGVSFPMILTVNSPTEIRKNDYIKNAHKLGLKVFPYTFQDDNLAFGRNSEEIYTLAKDYLEADGIFTEFFDVAITVYKTLNSQKN